MDTNEITDRAGVLHSESTDVPMNPTFWNQLKALVVRNILIKTRARRTLLVEMATPCIYLLILVALVVYFEMNALPAPPPHPGILPSFRALDGFLDIQNRTLAVAPQTDEVKNFMELVSKLWMDMQPDTGDQVHLPIQYQIFETADDLADNYWRDPQSFQIGIVFLDPYPISQKLVYELRGNPQNGITPPTTHLFSASDSCLGQGPIKRQWNGIFPDPGQTCPVQQYYLSGFIGVQALLDFAKIRVDSKQDDVIVPNVVLELLPRDNRELKRTPLEGVSTLEDLFKLVVVPTFLMLVMSQYTTYLIVVIVGEKESHSRTAMKIMGVRDTAYWMSWFLCYTILIAKLALIVLVVLFFSDFFPNSNYTLLFTVITLYGCSTINMSFILSTFFHNARTAGLLASFMTTLLSAVIVLDASLDLPETTLQYILALLSPIAFGKFLYLSMALEVKDSGITWSNMWYSSAPCPGGYMLMLIVDIIFYGLLAYYLDNVLPNEHSIRRSPLFFLHPNFWIKKRKKKATTMANGEPFTYLNAEESVEADIEAVPLELKGREAIRIEDLQKTFGSFCKPRAKAINGITLTIYEGQITAILGHNGAGKTTLFNILLGVTAPSSGSAYIYGYDVRDPNDLEQIRRMTGVCPQFDILFKTLTPREHLRFYGTIRGIPSSKLDDEIMRTLTELDLLDKADSPSSCLSGGQRRKLSIGNAIIGDPKIIVLDEPSAGVDPHSRRHMWSILQSRKAGKVILLTTHFMDEADILAERKAVISKGRIRCCGSSLFLKNKFGIGYHLTLVLNSDANEASIVSLVMRYVHKSERARRHGRELSFILPHNAVNSFPDLFAAIELEINKRRGLGITSYGVAMTTLEEVFLHLERDETEEIEHDTVMDNISKSMLRNRAMSRSLSIPSKSTSYHSLQNEGAVGLGAVVDSELGSATARQKKFLEKASSEPVPLSSASRKQMGNGGICSDSNSPSSAQDAPFLAPMDVKPCASQQLKAMLKLRVICLLRDIYKLFNLIVIPLIISTYLVYNSASHNRPPEMPALQLDGQTYQPNMRIALIANDLVRMESHELVRGLKSVGAVGVYTYGTNITQLMSEAPYIAALSMVQEDKNRSSPFKVTAQYNDTAQHSLPIVMNLISNAVYKMAMANSSRSNREINEENLIIKSHPLERQIDGSADLSYAFTAGSIGATFLTVAATIGVDMVYDREIRAKNQLRVNGLPFTIYFFTFFLVMLAVLFFIFLFLVFVAWLCSVAWLTSGPAVAMFGLLLLAFCPVAIVAATTLSYCFQKTESAASILPGLMLIPGLTPYIAIVFVKAQKVKELLHIIGSFIDPLYLPIGATNQMINQYILCMESARCRREGISMSDYATRDIAVIFGGCGVAFVIWSFILFVVDLRESGRSVQDLFRKKRATVSDGGENMDYGDRGDDDVRAERQKVARLMGEQQQSEKSPVVVVQNLRKIYDKDDGVSKCCVCCGNQDMQQKLAVRELSLAIDSGEVFGLLGHNGAGKTTTMKIIIAEEAPTRGQVQIAGYDVMSNMNDAFSKMGYCPQHDAQWKKVTVKEHLYLYAAIRGVPPSVIPRLIDSYIAGLQIKEHSNKRASACSGGTRRKLSFAMAMVGNPAVVLMDEPSSGMDPRSKRFLWDTILASFQGTRGAILTTHAMEEADALCSRVGIMVKGELRCIGPTQHLKNLYGAGYTLEMKLIDQSATTAVTERLANVLAYINSLFQDARLVESFSDRMVFEVPQKNVTSVATCFKNLEKAKEELSIAEYSFSQTTLEQVFLKFSHDNEEDD